MDFLSRMNEVIEYIEAHITDDINFNDVSRIVCCDIYQFGRIFLYVVGMPLTEYIRRRRLTLAALELQSGEIKVIDAALKYGYTSPDSFTRAFLGMHGVTPKQASVSGVKLKLYPRISFHITIKGDIDMNYRIVEKSKFTVVGVVHNFADMADKIYDGKIWDDFLDGDEKLPGGLNAVIRDKYKLYREPLWQMGVSHTLLNGNTIFAIGAESDGKDYPELASYTIPASTWAVFTGKGSVGNIKKLHGELLTRILTDWLPSSGYEKSMEMGIETFGPGDATSDDYTWEVWFPIKKK
jgi:AraC family transcriptional regulator